MDNQNYNHTVLCFTDKTKTKYFVELTEATTYANKLLRAGHKCKIYPYRPPRRYVDILAERGPNG
jgi:hypothetical protein